MTTFWRSTNSTIYTDQSKFFFLFFLLLKWPTKIFSDHWINDHFWLQVIKSAIHNDIGFHFCAMSSIVLRYIIYPRTQFTFLKRKLIISFKKRKMTEFLSEKCPYLPLLYGSVSLREFSMVKLFFHLIKSYFNAFLFTNLHIYLLANIHFCTSMIQIVFIH